MKKILTGLFFLIIFFLQLKAQSKIEKWGIFEISLQGQAIENPVNGHDLTAMFVHPSDTVIVKGFYDGNGIYKVRFMPSQTGEWQFLAMILRKFD